jgi:hypothetical protein
MTIKSRIGWAGHGEMRNTYKVTVRKLEGKSPLGGSNVHVGIILKFILKKASEDVN